MSLSLTSEIKVRFSDLDSMNIVWHGNYIRYFEDGREAFGKKYGLAYMDIYRQGFMAPLVHVNCDYKLPVNYEDSAWVETTYIKTPAAKIIFDYKILVTEKKLVAATGRSIQVFLNLDRQLELTVPEFYSEWKEKHGLK